MVKKVLIGVVATLTVMIAASWFFPIEMAAISVAAEKIFDIGSFRVTNALFTSVLLSLLILILAFIVGRRLKEQPEGMQNIVEFMIEGLDGLITSIAPKKWAATFFPILVTIFIYLIFANWFSLFTPLLGSFGIIHPATHGPGIPISEITWVSGGPESLKHHEGEADEHGATDSHSEVDETHAVETDHATDEEPRAIIVPLLRAPSSDLNLTLGLALITMTLVWVFGFREHGPKYMGNFIRISGFKEKGPMMWLIDFVIGIIELVSEFAKIISFSFRLFGNIFAGEVVLIVVSALVSFLLVIVFFGFEIFVGLIQAFVFFILSLVFFSLATQHHEH
jgi:F-type H+-transporting ATPase subunit a